MRRAVLVFLIVTLLSSAGQQVALAAQAGPTPTPEGADEYEPNDAYSTATLTGVGQTLQMTLHTGDPGDWVKVWFKVGRTYRVTAEVLPGGDTYLRLYTESLGLVAESDDRSVGDPSSEVLITSGREGFYYVQVTSKVSGLFAAYDLRVIEELPTPTPTLAPTATPGGDGHEPNDEFAEATTLLAGESKEGSITQGDLDFYRLYAKAGVSYRCDVNPVGFDSEFVTYNENKAETGRNDDRAPGDSGSSLSWTQTETGWTYLRVSSVVGAGAYTLFCTALSPTATPTPRPTATPGPEPTPNDAFEPNFNFETAADVVPGQTVQAVIDAGDNDFYRLYVKLGNVYRCDVRPSGFDSNLIVYDRSRNGIGGSDDRSPGDVGSSLTWYAGYTGWAYLLVGPVSGTGSYSMLCTVVLPTATPTSPPVPTQPTGTPVTVPTATAASGSGQPGPSSPEFSTPSPTPTPEVVFQATILIYYDANDNRSPEPQEGIRGASVILLNPRTNKPLAQAFTDQTGSSQLSYPGFERARIAVPYLAYSKEIRSGEHVIVRIKPQLLPGLLP